MRRTKAYTKLMNTTRWRAVRNMVLAEHPLCARCEEQGRITAATEVHHIIPIESEAASSMLENLAYNRANLQPLCHYCHYKIHEEMAKNSKGENVKRQRSRAEQFALRFGGVTPGG